jgi:hypothetical protein
MSWNVCDVRRLGVVCLIAVSVAATCGAQDEGAWPEARSADVVSIEAMMKAAYEAVSAKPGEERDLDRFLSLWRPGSRLLMVARTGGGEVSTTFLTLDDFVRMFSGPVADGVYELESNLITEVFGNMAHAWSTYEISSEGIVTFISLAWL